MNAEWYNFGLNIIGIVCIPLVAMWMSRQSADRQQLRLEMHKRLDHLDECLDDTKKIVLGSLITRDEMTANKIEQTEILNRMRIAISAETHGLHERIMRLENKWFGASS